MKDSISFPKLPFYWRTHSGSQPNIVPNLLPFKFDFDRQLQLVQQERNRSVLEHLNQIYKADYNVGYLQEDNKIAAPYGKDFFRFIGESLGQKKLQPKTVLEIGCGGCLILDQLKKMGMDVLGIDPSPIAVREGKKRDIEIVSEFFPSQQISKRFDLIVHSDLLEHTEDPVGFLSQQVEHLAPGGSLIAAVPDCTESIRLGDVSMIIHQHLNYFDEESLYKTVAAAGFGAISIEKAKYGGSLYCIAECSDKIEIKETDDQSEHLKIDDFAARFKEVDQTFKSFITEVIQDSQRTLGFYVPLRAFPYLASLEGNSDFTFFDQNKNGTVFLTIPNFGTASTSMVWL